MKLKRNSKKFYKKGEPKKVEKLPRNYRIIPERINLDDVVFLTGIISIFLAVLIISFNLYSNIGEQKRLTDEKISIISGISFWNNEVRLHPDYRDGYFSLAVLNYQIGDLEKAKLNLDKALLLDPNFQKGRELEQMLLSE